MVFVEVIHFSVLLGSFLVAIVNGSEFLFLKALRQPVTQYTNSRLFSLVNPGNELYAVLQILKQLGRAVVTTENN
ncbi:hypothetical protein POG22_11475 [Geitlerinema sp. CS-897]|nr:hypothetical protein [Geitlerinema sp. CS-897]